MRFVGSMGIAALLGTLAGLFATRASFAQETPSAEHPAKWGASLDLEGKLGTERDLGEADLLVPLAQDDRTLFFANVRFRLDDSDSKEGNLGLGLRRMVGEWNLGGYGYFDRRRSGTGNFYNQTTFGAEALGRDVDFRVNGYVPIGDRTHDLGSSSGGSSTAALSGTTIQVFTTGAQMREERAIGGFDAEIGWRVPLFDAEAPYDFRLYGGGFWFDDKEVEAIAGPRLRAEFTAYEVPGLWQGARVTVGAEWQHDDVRGGQSFASLRLRIPLQSEAQRSQPLTAQEQRMTIPVVRDIDIVTQSRTATFPAIMETATETADGSAITVLSDTSTSGAALPGAVAAAGNNATVILSGTFNTTLPITMQPGQTVMGAGSLAVRSASGRTAVLTTPIATIAGAVHGNSTVGTQTNNTLTGLNISNALNITTVLPVTAVDVSGGNGNTITNNTITVNATGNSTSAVGISIVEARNVTISGNTVTATSSSGPAYALWVRPFSSPGASLMVTGNALGATGGTDSIHTQLDSSFAPITILSGSSNNTFTAGTCLSPGGLPITGSISYSNGSTCP